AARPRAPRRAAARRPRLPATAQAAPRGGGVGAPAALAGRLAAPAETARAPADARAPPQLPGRVPARAARPGRAGARLQSARPRSSEDRAGAFEAPCAGSIPAGAIAGLGLRVADDLAHVDAHECRGRLGHGAERLEGALRRPCMLLGVEQPERMLDHAVAFE